MGSLSQFEEYAGPLLRGHLRARKDIGGIGFLKAVENADYFLHDLILRCFFDCGWLTPCARCGATSIAERDLERLARRRDSLLDVPIRVRR